jgi:hypothetical protein
MAQRFARNTAYNRAAGWSGGYGGRPRFVSRLPLATPSGLALCAFRLSRVRKPLRVASPGGASLDQTLRREAASVDHQSQLAPGWSLLRSAINFYACRNFDDRCLAAGRITAVAALVAVNASLVAPADLWLSALRVQRSWDTRAVARALRPHRRVRTRFAPPSAACSPNAPNTRRHHGQLYTTYSRTPKRTQINSRPRRASKAQTAVATVPETSRKSEFCATARLSPKEPASILSAGHRAAKRQTFPARRSISSRISGDRTDRFTPLLATRQNSKRAYVLAQRQSLQPKSK